MRRLWLLVVALLIAAIPGYAQNTQGNNQSNIGGLLIASNFAQWTVPQGNQGGYSWSSPDFCKVTFAGETFNAFSVGTPVQIVDTGNAANSEVVTVNGFHSQNNGCSINVTPARAHNTFFFKSATAGLGEALAFAGQQLYQIVLTPDWTKLGGLTATITSASGNANVTILDQRSSVIVPYLWNVSAYVANPFSGGGTVSNPLTMNNSGAGAASGTTYNGSAAETFSYNSIGAAPLASPAFTGTPTVPTATAGTNTTQAASTAFVLANGSNNRVISVTSYGALCNWNGTTGTDDSAGFQAAANAAGAIYAATGSVVSISVPYGCTLGTGSGQTTINTLGGTHWQGPGSIFVPAQSANPLFDAFSASDVGWSGLEINMVTNLTACGPTQNNALCSAIRWDGATPGTNSAYSNVTVTGNTIVNSGWGIAIIAQAGNDTLAHVHVDGNTVKETQNPITSYQYADGIHVGGAISDITISHNIVTGRADAGIAVTTEATNRLCSGVAITGNVVFEDRIGIDDSGCASLQVTGNLVHADIATATSNPAFRSIYYNGLPTNVNVMGNNFENYQGFGSDVSAKYDCEGGCGNGSGTVNPFNSKFTGNKIFSFYMRGSGIDFSANTFEPSGTFELDWDTTNGNPSYNDTIGQNSWQGNGSFGNDSRSDVYAGSKLAPQVVVGTITYSNPGEISPIPVTYSSIIDTALGSSTSPVCPNGTGGALTTSGCAGGGVPNVNGITGATTIAGSGGTSVNTTGSTITVSSTSSGGVSNANFMFVGDSITCGNQSTSGCANLGPGAGTPVVINSTGYTASTTGTASSGSTALTVASATGIQNGELVVGAGIAPGTLITAITGTSITLSQATTAALSTTAVSFGNMDYPAQAMRRPALTGNSNTGINAGVSGWRSDQIISAYTTIVHPYAPSVTGKPGYLFVQIGTNDIFQGIPPATTAANLSLYWQTAKADGWTVIALTIPIGPWSGTQYGWWISLNSYIRANGAQYDRLVDETMVLNNDFDTNLFYTDNIHPINPGYTILAQLAAAAITTSESVRPSPIVLPLGASNCLSNPSCFAANYFPSVQNAPLITTGFYNAAAGWQAMRFATTDYQNTAFGANALPNVNGSHGNSGFGHYIFQNLSTGANNSAVGDSVCPTVTTGSYVNCFGVGSDVSAGAATDRTQIGQGTNATDHTVQFDAWNIFNTTTGAFTSVLGSEESVASSATPTFSVNFRESTNVLTANVTSFTLAAGIAGQEKTLTFCQNGTGGYTVAPPSNVHGFMTVGTTASTCSSQHFTYNSTQAAWLADSPGVINQ